MQVYIGKKDSKVERAIKEFKGFKKTNVKGNSLANISITIDADDLAYWNKEIDGWELEKGEYFAAIGNVSDNFTKEIAFTIK